MAVSGWSYGGSMTAWLLGNYPDRWRAGVAGEKLAPLRVAGRTWARSWENLLPWVTGEPVGEKRNRARRAGRKALMLPPRSAGRTAERQEA